MITLFKSLIAFHHRIGAHLQSLPGFPSRQITVVRRVLIREEYEELMDAFDRGDTPDVASAIADLIWLLVGTAVAFGIPLPEVWEAVCCANMAKLANPEDPDGKALKPAGWEHLDIWRLLACSRIDYNAMTDGVF